MFTEACCLTICLLSLCFFSELCRVSDERAAAVGDDSTAQIDRWWSWWCHSDNSIPITCILLSVIFWRWDIQSIFFHVFCLFVCSHHRRACVCCSSQRTSRWWCNLWSKVGSSSSRSSSALSSLFSFFTSPSFFSAHLFVFLFSFQLSAKTVHGVCGRHCVRTLARYDYPFPFLSSDTSRHLVCLLLLSDVFTWRWWPTLVSASMLTSYYKSTRNYWKVGSECQSFEWVGCRWQ